MKIASYFVIMFLVLSLSLTLISADSSCSPTISLISQDPAPAIPDSYVKVIFEVTGLLNCGGFAVKLDPQYPFSLDPGTNPIQTIADTSYTTDYQNTWTIPYNVRVAADALEGDYALKLNYHLDNNPNFDSYATQNFSITLKDAQTNFDVVIQDVTGSQVSLGVINTGKNLANSLVVSIPKQDNFLVTGPSKQILGNLAAGDYSTLAFNIASVNLRNFTRQVNNSFNYGSNPVNNPMLNVQLDYTDGIGTRRTVIKQISADSLIMSGNFTRTGSRTGFGVQTAKTPSISVWGYIVGLIIIIFIVIKYRELISEKFKLIYSKRFKKKQNIHDPDWVSAERKSRRK